MPILWRYLLRSYFQVLALCVLGFIAILLVTRFKEIASFASASTSFGKVLIFILYQIPYILPIAIPISCLIASMLLFQKLSHTHELTAFRSCGLGLKPIAHPLILAGLLLSLFNFIIASEVGPYCRGLSKQLVYQVAASNPLILMQRDTLLKMKNSYMDMKALKGGKKAEDVIYITKNSSNGRLGLMTAKELQIQEDLLKGDAVTFISSIDPKKKESFDHLVIENQKTMQTKASTLTLPMQKAEWIKSQDYLPLRMILAKEAVEKEDKPAYYIGRHARAEICRRITLGLGAFTFTLIGIAYGLEISRQRRKKGVIWAFALAGFFMVCFIAARSLKHSPSAACWVFLLPHPIILLLCLRQIKSVSRGVE